MKILDFLRENLAEDEARFPFEVDAKRRLIVAVLEYESSIDGEFACGHDPDQIAAGQCRNSVPENIVGLCALAMAYRDRPNFDPMWLIPEDAPEIPPTVVTPRQFEVWEFDDLEEGRFAWTFPPGTPCDHPNERHARGETVLAAYAVSYGEDGDLFDNELVWAPWDDKGHKPVRKLYDTNAQPGEIRR